MKPALAICVLLAGCATAQTDTSNLGVYCTPENAYRLGSQSRAYFGVCPKESEARFLEGLARGRQVRPWAPQVEPYYQQMQQTEARLVAATSDSEREPLRARLRDLEWWAVHLINNKATFHD
jgi:uncharacterized protein DUF2799